MCGKRGRGRERESVCVGGVGGQEQCFILIKEIKRERVCGKRESESVCVCVGGVGGRKQERMCVERERERECVCRSVDENKRERVCVGRWTRTSASSSSTRKRER